MTLAATQAALLRLYGDPAFRRATLAGDLAFLDGLAPAEQAMLRRLLDHPAELKRFGREITGKKLAFLSNRFDRSFALLPGLEAAVDAEFHRSWVLSDGGVGDDLDRFADLMVRVAGDVRPAAAPVWAEVVDLQRRQARLLFDPPVEPGTCPDDGPPATLDANQPLRRATDVELVTYAHDLDAVSAPDDLAGAPVLPWLVALVPHRHQPTVRTVTLTAHLHAVLAGLDEGPHSVSELVDALLAPLDANQRDGVRPAAQRALADLAAKGVLLPG